MIVFGSIYRIQYNDKSPFPISFRGLKCPLPVTCHTQIFGYLVHEPEEAESIFGILIKNITIAIVPEYTMYVRHCAICFISMILFNLHT